MYSLLRKRSLFPWRTKHPERRYVAANGDHRPIILGIESSCDDTGCGIVDDAGKILGEAIRSQHLFHLNNGGIVPSLAANAHRANVTDVCEQALRSADLRLKDVTAIAATVKPGLLLSLQVGSRFGKYLSIVGNKPFVPIHHMEAHALAIRLTEKVDFPYLAFLISGGHCLLAIVDNVDKFYVLGKAIDNTPGEVLDKIARRLKLRTIPGLATLSGGRAVEVAAEKATDPERFRFPIIMTHRSDCNFSFSSVFSECMKLVTHEEKKLDVRPDETIPDVYDMCAKVQLVIAQHLCQRLRRAIEFIRLKQLVPNDRRTLVVSGGVACNNFFADRLEAVCREYDYRFARTPAKLCTDNGVMIAWNGMERWLANAGVVTDRNEIENVPVEDRAPLGLDISDQVADARIKSRST